MPIIMRLVVWEVHAVTYRMSWHTWLPGDVCSLRYPVLGKNQILGVLYQAKESLMWWPRPFTCLWLGSASKPFVGFSRGVVRSSLQKAVENTSFMTFDLVTFVFRMVVPSENSSKAFLFRKIAFIKKWEDRGLNNPKCCWLQWLKGGRSGS